MQAASIAEHNFNRHIRHNSYPGRGIVVGRSSIKDAWLMIYWIMGRSNHSRNRRFIIDGNSLKTEPVDVGLVEDPSLIIYEAMLELSDIYLVGNGDQTRTIYEALEAGRTFDDALATREREPDAPNYTPRISAMLTLQRSPGRLTFNILKANLANPELTDRFTFRPAAPPPGLGYCLTTYQEDEQPLPSFDGDPLLLPCIGSAEEVLGSYWNALDADNRISLAVKEILAQGSASKVILRNRFGESSR